MFAVVAFLLFVALTKNRLKPPLTREGALVDADRCGDVAGLRALDASDNLWVVGEEHVSKERIKQASASTNLVQGKAANTLHAEYNATSNRHTHTHTHASE